MKLRKLTIALLLRFSLLVFLTTNLFAQGKLTATIFDMKTHGLAMVMQTPSGKTWLIDTGNGLKEDYLAAREAIVPYLRKAGIKSIDGVIISHPHSDHQGGLPYIMEHYKIGQLVDAGYDEIGGDELETYRKVRAQYIAGGGKSVIVKTGSKLDIDPGLDVEVLWPPQGLYYWKPGLKDADLYNSNSIVLRVQHGSVVFMFPGDHHGIAGVAKYVDPQKLKCDLLVAPHHGINSSPAQDNATKPKYVVLSSRDDSSIRLFDLAKNTFVDAQVFATWIDGTVTAISDGKTISVSAAGKP